MASVPAHFHKLVQLVARSFYAGECPPKDQEDQALQKTSKKTQVPLIGLGVVILDGLLRREWVKEDELAADLKIHPRILRKALRWFEQAQLVTREDRKDTRKRKKADEASETPSGREASGGAVSGSAERDMGAIKLPVRLLATDLALNDLQEQLVTREHRKEARKRKTADEASGRPSGKEASGGGSANGPADKDIVVENADELPPQALLHSYSCLDFASILDVTQLRVHKLRKLMKDRMQNSQPVLEYSCPRCGAIYNTLQAAALIDFRDGQFHCEHCATVLVTAEAAEGVGDASARRERLKAMKELQVRMEKELAPLLAALEDAKKKVASEKKVPSYGTLKEWAQARADALTIAMRGARRGDGMLTPAQVEVDLSGQQGLSAAAEEVAVRELPPWMRAEAPMSVSRSTDSTGAAQQLNAAQQQASSTEQQDLQAAYAKQWEEQVRKKQAELASRAAADPAAQQPGGLGAVKADGGWTTETPEPPSQPSSAIKAEPKKEETKAEADGINWQAAEHDDEDDEEWEEA